jgi:hypothetical protein
VTKKNYASWVALCLGISSILLLLFACSEQPNQRFEETKPRVNQTGNEAIEGKPHAIVQNDQASTELIMALKETRMALKESEILLRDAPGGKDSDEPLKALQRELQAAESFLNEIRKTIEQGDYLKAKVQIHEITDRTNHVNQQIMQAIRKQERGS